MAQVKPESKDILDFQVRHNISLQLCETKNLLEKKRMLLGHICYDTNGFSWKTSASRTLFGPWIDCPTCYGSTCTLKVLITVTQTETQRLNMISALTYLMRRSLMLRQTNCLHWLFYWQEAKMQRCAAKY